MSTSWRLEVSPSLGPFFLAGCLLLGGADRALLFRRLTGAPGTLRADRFRFPGISRICDYSKREGQIIVISNLSTKVDGFGQISENFLILALN